MESLQCLEGHDGATITDELCLPSHDQIAADIRAMIDTTGIKSVFIGSDSDPKTGSLQEKLGPEVIVAWNLWPSMYYVGQIL